MEEARDDGQVRRSARVGWEGTVGDGRART